MSKTVAYVLGCFISDSLHCFQLWELIMSVGAMQHLGNLWSFFTEKWEH